VNAKDISVEVVVPDTTKPGVNKESYLKAWPVS
jgi:hypothetical protein